jgi:hypothetical protein
MNDDQSIFFGLDAFSVRKGNFLKYKNQYFFYKKTGFAMGCSQRKEKKEKNSYKAKNHHVRRDGFYKLLS